MHSFDSFEEWLTEFVESLTRHIGEAQANKFIGGFRSTAREYFEKGLAPQQAVAKELL